MAEALTGMVRLAIIGLGAVTRNIHLPAYARLKGEVRVVAGCDPDPAARAAARAEWGVPEVYDDARLMIERERPEVVAVCTPPAQHAGPALLALERGCHVFCEKPLAESLDRADEMIAAARGAHRLLAVNSQFPQMNIHRAAKARIGSPEFGRLLFLHAWQTLRPTAQTEAGWRGELRRRLCFEFGVHVFELIRYFFDDTPVRLLAHMPRPRPEVEADVINVVSMEFADGRAATVVLDRLSRGPERYLEMRLDGERAAIRTSIGGEVSLALGLHTRERRPFARLSLVKGGQAVWQDGSRAKVIARDGINPFASATAAHFAGFLGALRGGGVPPGEAGDNRRTLALACAAYDAAELGRAVELGPYLSPRGA